MKRRILELSNALPNIPIVCASCTPMSWTDGDVEIAGRWNDYYELTPYTGDRLVALLAFLDLLLPFSEPSFLALRAADYIQKATGGVLRDVMILIWDACRRAIEGDKRYVTLELIEETWNSIVTKRLWSIPGGLGEVSRTA